jgi:methylthioribulose-1-phosphate dehydratase
MESTTQQIVSDLKEFEDLNETHPRKLIPELCRLFYNLGWVTGTGGGISMRLG